MIVIAIANTMDLPERVMMNRVSSRLGLTRQTFQPYTHTAPDHRGQQGWRGCRFSRSTLIQLVARKVATACLGTPGGALDICRRPQRWRR